MEIEVNNVVCRPIKEDELEMIRHWRMLPEITKYMYTDPKLTSKGQQEWYKKIKQSVYDLVFMIEIDDIPVGILNINHINRKLKKCSWGYYIAVKEKRSIQLAIDLECSLYDYVFEVLDLERLEGEIFAFNKGVVRIHQMCGSEIEEKLDRYIYKNGIYYDVIRMGISRNKWSQIKQNIKYSKINFHKG